MAIYFFDKNQTLIKIVPESATLEAIQTQELDDDSLLKDTLSVTVKGDEKLLGAEYMAAKSYTGNAQTFDMYRIVTDTTPDKSMSFTGMSLAPYELNGHILQDLRPANHSLSYTLNRVLDGTDWRVGYIEDGLSNVTTTFYYVSAKEALKELQSLIGCEFVFKVEISGQKITDKWIEVYKEMGNRTKKRFSYGTNALTVVRETNKADIYTALIGRGKGEEVSSGEDNASGQAGYGRKITFEDIEWKKSSGKPLDKPKGQYYLELPQATQAYGIKNIDGTMKARVGIVDFDDEEDKNRLINLTYQQLLVSSRPKVLFKTTVANIGATGIGDTVTIHRHDLNIHYQTRVRKIVRNKLNDNKTQIELGDAVVTASTKQTKHNNATIKNLNNEIDKIKANVTTSQNSADGKNTIFYGSAEPERQRTGDTWYRPHPSIAGETQMLTWNGTAWELVLDTSDLTSVSREVKNAVGLAEEAKALAVSEAESALAQAKADATAKANAIKEQITGEVNTAITTAEDAQSLAVSEAERMLAQAKADATAKDNAIKEQIGKEVNTAIETAESAKSLAVSEAENALAQAKADATAKTNAVKEEVGNSVNTAIETAENAKQTAIDNYNNAVTEATRLDGEQKIAFDKKFDDIEDSVDTFNESVSDVDAKADTALEKAGANANLLTTHQNTLNTINDITIPNVVSSAETALSNAKLAMDEAKAVDGKVETFKTKIGNTVSDVNIKAQKAIDDVNLVDGKVETFKTDVGKTISTVSDSAKSALDEAKKTDGKIADYVTRNALISSTDAERKISEYVASKSLISSTEADNKISDYVTRNGLVSGTTVDTKINDATGKITKNIRTVESKIPTGAGINLISQSASGYTDGYIVGIGDIGQPLVIREFNMNTLSGYIDIGNKGLSETFTFSKQMMGSGDGFFRIVWLDEFGNVLQRDTNNSEKVTIESPLNAVQVRLSFPTGSKPKMEKGSVATPWTPAPEDNYTQSEFKIFESSYSEDVKGINSKLVTVENNISDANTAFTTFKENEYKRTAERVSDTFTKQETNTILGGKADKTQLNNYLAKSVYERDAEQSKLRFEKVENDKADTTYVDSEVKNSADEIKTTLTSYAKSTDLIGLATETYATNKAVSEAGKVSSELTKYELKTGVDSKISTASSALRTETAEKLRTVYTKTETENLLGNKADSSALNNYVQQATYESGIDGVSQSITRVEGKIPTYVGGRNLLRGTADFNTPLWRNVSTAIPSTRDSRYKQVRVDGDFTVAPITTMSVQGWNFEIGQEYVISVWAKSEVLGNKLGVTVQSTPYFDPQVVSVSEWRRYVWKFTATISSLTNFRFETRNGERVWITQPQVEKGTILTDWSPAPEDNYTQSEFKIFESSYTSSVNGITSRLSTAENSITTNNHAFTTFKENDYKRTAERVSDTFTKSETTTMLGDKADASQLSNYLAKSTYERDAEQSKERFETIETNKADTTYVNSEVKNSADEIKTTLNSYAKSSDLTGLATETYASNIAVSEAGKVKNELTKYAKTTDLAGLASETYATNVAVSEAEKVSNELTKYAKSTDLTGLATETYAQTQATTEAGKVEQKLTGYAKSEDLSGLATETYATNIAVSEAGKVSSELTKYELKTGVDSKVSTLATALRTETADKMKTVYTKTETENLLGDKADNSALNDYVQEATYTAGINGINGSITTIKGRLDNLQVGGRNLLRGAADFNTPLWRNVSTAMPSDFDSRYKQVRVDGDFNVAPITTMSVQGWNFEIGQEYVVSVYAKSEELGNKLGVTVQSTPYFNPQVVTLSKWTRYIWKFTATMSNLTNFRFETRNDEKVWITQPQIEKGSVPTDWSPAPEDMLGKADFQVFKGTYESNDQAIKNRLTAIDSSEEGSVVNRLNQTEKTANGNTTTISDIKTKPDEQITGYQTIKERSDLYERVIGKDEAGVKSNISKIVQTSEIIQQTVTSAMNVENRNLLITKNATNDSWLTGSEGYPKPTPQTNSGTSTSPDLIEVKSDDKFTLSKNETTLFFRVSFLNSSKVYIGRYVQGAKLGTIVPPSGTAYMWVSYPTNADAKIEKGSIATGYSPAPEDTATQSQITQLVDNINLRVTKEGLLNQINVSAGGVLIQSGTNKLNITPETTFIADATIKSAMIDTVNVKQLTGIAADFTSMVTGALTANTITSTMINANDAMFTKLFATKLATDKLVAQGAWITDANIVSLDAGTIKSGTIDTGRLDAGAIVTGGLSANVVKSTHIESSVGLIDKIFANEALITRLTSNSIFASKIKAINIDASRITTGELDAARIKSKDVVTAGLSANVIKSEHILGSTALIDKIFADDAYITRMTGKTAFVSSIQAISINADKITTGTLDASKVSVVNLDANSITANKTSFIQSNWNDIESSIKIDGRGLLSTASDNSQVYLQNGIVGARNPNGATIGQIGYAYQTESPWYSMQISHGSHFQIRMDRAKGELNKQAFYIISGGTESYLNTDNIYFNPSATGRVRVQGAMTVDKDLRVDGTILVRSRLEYLNGGYIESQAANSNILINATNKLVIYTNGTNALEFDANNAVFRRKVSDNSDIRLKTNIVDMPINSLEAIRNIEIKKFDYLDGRTNYYGIIAQQAQNYLPELINTDSEGYLMVDKSAMTYVNMHAIQQLNTKVDDEITKLKSQIASLQDELALLKGA